MTANKEVARRCVIPATRLLLLYKWSSIILIKLIVSIRKGDINQNYKVRKKRS